MADQRKIFNRIHGERKAEEIMHSSTFARAQSERFGSTGPNYTPGNFADQRSANARRRFVKGYENAQLVRGAYTVERARQYVPRTKSSFGSRGIGGIRRDTSGDGFSGSLMGR